MSSLEKRIRDRMDGKKIPKPGEPPRRKTAEEIVSELSLAQREKLYDEIVRQGWED